MRKRREGEGGEEEEKNTDRDLLDPIHTYTNIFYNTLICIYMSAVSSMSCV